MAHRAAYVGAIIVGTAMGAHAQGAAPATQMVNVDGRAMRVAVAGLDQRKPGQPVIVLEAGAAETNIEEWTPAFALLARVAPVIAYDRRGVGKSAADTEKVTLRRTAQSLHALLQRLSIAPPYVLVGHSWGGLVIRAYFDQYAPDVAGFVFLDALNPPRTRDEHAKDSLPTIPPETPPGLRAEYELILSEMGNDFPEARTLRLPSGVPVAVVSAMPPGRFANREGFDAGPTDLAGIALRSPKGMYVVAGHVGHNVQRDDPDLVVRLVEHVIKHAAR